MRALLIGLVWLAGCIKAPAVQQSLRPVPVAMTATLVSSEQPGDLAVPPQVQERLTDEVTRRGLVAVGPSGDPAQLLQMEISARFSTQVNGRYRWNVDAALSLTDAEDPAVVRTTSASVPVALVYSHQDATDALEEAAPLIARQLGAMLDAWIADEDS